MCGQFKLTTMWFCGLRMCIACAVSRRCTENVRTWRFCITAGTAKGWVHEVLSSTMGGLMVHGRGRYRAPRRRPNRDLAVRDSRDTP